MKNVAHIHLNGLLKFPAVLYLSILGWTTRQKTIYESGVVVAFCVEASLDLWEILLHCIHLTKGTRETRRIWTTL